MRGRIGITGPMGAGKSFAATVLASEIAARGSTVGVVEFAAPLKRIVALLTGIRVREAFENATKARHVESIRCIDPRDAVEALTGSNYDPNRLEPAFGRTHRVLFDQFMAAFDRLFEAHGETRRIRAHPEGATFGRLLQLMGTEGMRHVLGADVFVCAARARCAALACDVVILPDVRFENEAAFVRENGRILHIEPAFDLRTGDGRSVAHSSESGVAQCSVDARVQNRRDASFSKTIVDALLIRERQ